MKYLLDTHICLWAISNKSKLSTTTRSILEEGKSEIFVSQISLWEIAIKYKLGKFPEFNVRLEEFIDSIADVDFTILPLKNEHLTAYFAYPHFNDDHKDPFDRLLLVTAVVKGAGFITKDEKFDAYKKQIEVVW